MTQSLSKKLLTVLDEKVPLRKLEKILIPKATLTRSKTLGSNPVDGVFSLYYFILKEFPSAGP